MTTKHNRTRFKSADTLSLYVRDVKIFYSLCDHGHPFRKWCRTFRFQRLRL